MPQLDKALVPLAARAIEAETEVSFGQGSDYQGDLSLSWEAGVFHAVLSIYSDPHTRYGSWYDAPETTWREQVDTFESPKIKDVSDWIKAEWGFDLAGAV
jgi:hypothetical protein